MLLCLCALLSINLVYFLSFPCWCFPTNLFKTFCLWTFNFRLFSLFETGPLLPTWLGQGIELAGENTEKGSQETIFSRYSSRDFWMLFTNESPMICYSSSCLLQRSTRLWGRKLKCSAQSTDLKADSNTFDVTKILCCYVMNPRIVRMFLLSISPSSHVVGTQRGADNGQSDPSN